MLVGPGLELLSIDGTLYAALTYRPDQTIVAFAARLKDTVDLDSVQTDLVRAAQEGLEPAHVWVWISPRG
jgi:hypothetical protein